MQTAGIHWKSKSTWIDIHTGQIITGNKHRKKYIKLKTRKNVTINELKTHGTIEYTIECQRNPQIELI